MQTRRKIITLVGVGFLLVSAYVGLQRPWSTPALTHAPDEKHVHQVFGDVTLNQKFIAPTNTFDGVRLYISTETTPSPQQTLQFIVLDPQTDKTLRTVTTTFDAALDPKNPEELFIPFEHISGIHGSPLEFEIAVPGASKSDALRIRYQSGKEKYPQGESYSSVEEKQGNLGFVLYERPTLAKRITRWLLDPGHILALVGVVATVGGLVTAIRTRKNLPAPSHMPSVRFKDFVIVLALVTAAIFILYAPALKLFYYFDDVPILARAENFSQTNPWQLVTARMYYGADADSKFSLIHWRPLSAGLYPLIIIKAFGTSATAGYAMNLFIMALTGTGLALIAYTLLRTWWAAAIATTVWLAHTSRLGVVYWWSSSQELVASLFFTAGLLAYIYWRATNKRWVFIASLVVYFLALLSKEHTILLPVLLFAVEWLIEPAKTLRQRIATTLPALSWFAAVAGIFLLLRTIALWDPALPPLFFTDTTYDLSIDVSSIAKNTLAYSAWTVEHQIWPEFLSVDKHIQSWKDPVRIEKPLYPGLLLPALYLGVLGYNWKNKRRREFLVFIALWWVVLIGPLFFIQRIWFARWLYMPVFALGLALAYGWLHLPKRFQRPVAVLFVALYGVYGFWYARQPEPTRVYREQSAYTQEAIRQATSQRDELSPDSRIFAVGVTENQRTSITNYLFYLAYKREVPLVRVDEVPSDVGPHDIVIDMSDYDAYYPEND